MSYIIRYNAKTGLYDQFNSDGSEIIPAIAEETPRTVAPAQPPDVKARPPRRRK